MHGGARRQPVVNQDNLASPNVQLRTVVPEVSHLELSELLAAPAMVALMWNGLFGRFEKIDVREILQAHIDILFGERKAS